MQAERDKDITAFCGGFLSASQTLSSDAPDLYGLISIGSDQATADTGGGMIRSGAKTATSSLLLTHVFETHTRPTRRPCGTST
jgi:hypothetical protein